MTDAELDFAGVELLTSRERDVLVQLIGGASNKEVAQTLGISPRTVEVHRANLMHKLKARNAADLVRIVMRGRSGQSACGSDTKPFRAG